MADKNVCNLCGKELEFFDLQNDFTIHRKVQYGSIYDGYTVNLKLCCDCFDDLVQQCKVNPMSEEWSI